MLNFVKKMPSFAAHLLTAMGGVIITLLGLWVTQVPDLISRAETISIIAHEVGDLDAQVNEKLEAVDKLRESIDRNTTAVNDLKVKVSTLSTSMEYLKLLWDQRDKDRKSPIE